MIFREIAVLTSRDNDIGITFFEFLRRFRVDFFFRSVKKNLDAAPSRFAADRLHEFDAGDAFELGSVKNPRGGDDADSVRDAQIGASQKLGDDRVFSRRHDLFRVDRDDVLRPFMVERVLERAFQRLVERKNPDRRAENV